MSLGPSEIIVVLLVALIVLGPDKLPQAARTFGKYMAEFRKFSAAVQAQVDDALKVPEDAPPVIPGSQSESSSAAGTADVEESAPLPPNPDTTGFELIDQQLSSALDRDNKDREA